MSHIFVVYETVPFTNLSSPLDCAYYGMGIQLPSCIITSFSGATVNHVSTVETWTIELTEFSLATRATAKDEIIKADSIKKV